MNVVLDAELFSPERGDTMMLLALLHLGYQGRHHIVPDLIDDPRIESWLQARGDFGAQAARLAFEGGIREQTRAPNAPLTVRITSENSPPRIAQSQLILSLSDAEIFLRAEFRVIVENDVSDRHFLLAMMRPEWRARILAMESNGWLRFEFGGGLTHMINLVTEVRTSITEKSSVWVLFDSDSLAPQRHGPYVRELITACTDHVPFHCLQRRAIENYIPYMALDYWTSHDDGRSKRSKFRALRDLTPLQQAHFNMKFGFKGDLDRNDLANVGALYDGLTAEQRNELASGFGKNISEIFQRHNWPTCDWWISAGAYGGEPQQMIEALFSHI